MAPPAVLFAALLIGAGTAAAAYLYGHASAVLAAGYGVILAFSVVVDLLVVVEIEPAPPFVAFAAGFAIGIFVGSTRQLVRLE